MCEVSHAVTAISITKKRRDGHHANFPPHDFPGWPKEEEGTDGERKEDGSSRGTTSGVWRKKKKWWSEKPPLSIRRKEKVHSLKEETTARPETWKEAGINEESHSSLSEPQVVNRDSRRASSSCQEAYVVAAADDDEDDADNNNAWETAECEKNAQGVPICLTMYVHLGCIGVLQLPLH